MPRVDRNDPIGAILTGALDRFRVKRAVAPLAPDERDQLVDYINK